ncbi:MAG: sugar-binding protein [Moorea sp. SIO4E2]|uniref:SpvB/TcaC N-terminal domain-containing protein n=1 Tax=Moorena sp. SIO4E2 TaxID=2607826 RepID=UPI0013BA1C21|nr:SpvB/TcaC N-terminal domain-containing protein [Moorena sp. SIO4E2]NEQ05878.1 sugar-binding protein [Moorena sp. SIO4E2]
MENSKITTTQLSLPKGGGAIQGIGETFQANEFTGTAGLSIPIPTTPSRGFEPQLSVQYSSGSGNGTFGLGFALAIPNISRKTSKGLPKYDGTDTFILSNADDLVPVGNRTQGSYEITSYRPRTEGLFAKIEQWRDRTTGSSYWQVISSDNITSRYGKTAQARICDPENNNHVFEWLLEESFDAKGNYIIYRYKEENTQGIASSIYEANRTQTANKYIEKIQYGNDQPLQPGDDLSNVLWHFEVIFDYGEYNIYPTNTTPYTPVGEWINRPDPFSTYHAGFEIRTHRLCRNILMFHRFTELDSEPVLVHATGFHYREDANITFLTAAEAIGYRYENNQYQTKSLPALEFDYTPFQPEGHNFEPFLGEDSLFLPGLISSEYQILDLYGEGIPGVLYNDGTTTLYWEPAAKGEETQGVRYNPPQQPLSLPLAYGKTNNQQLIDLTGNGQLDLVVSSPNVSGYYEVKSDRLRRAKGDRTWQGFQTFPAFPNEYLDPDSQLTDITGDGLLDVLRLESDRIKVYPGKGKAGFGPAIIQQPENDLPLERKGDRTEALRFADIFGTGRQHLVRIKSGLVECWPSLGYGKFGKKVTLGNAPSFGIDFDISRLFLADIDGSGTADILYVKSDRVEIWFNQSGNSFSQTPLTIYLPSNWNNLDQISFADVYGNGTTCLIFSEEAPRPRHWCYDFCQRTKPHLLNQTDNNLGATTRITYGTSTKYYLEDKQNGQPWITNLPFPVQVIEKVENWDAISQTKLVSSYSYHHGYYDEVEREFFGFGMIERLDAETLSSDAQPYDVPPVLSKTWYHTGAWQGEESLSKQYEPEYFPGDPAAHQFPDSVFDANGQEPDSETWREAHRALKGMVLREELYGKDDSPQQTNPYTVSQSNYRVKLIQPKGENKYGIYFVHPQESLTYDYERNPADPRIGHEFVLEVDQYGNVLSSCAVAYGRRPGEDPLPEQLSLKITYSADSFINQTQDFYLLGVPQDNRSYEIKNLSLPSGQQYFAFADVKDHLEGVTDSPETPLLSWQRHYYWDPEREEFFPLGEVGPQALPYGREIAEFSPEQVEAAFEGALTKDKLDELLENQGSYVLGENYWWNRGLTQAYNPADQFYLPQATTDPFGNATRYEYDGYNLLAVKVTDALNNETLVQAIDYQTLQPLKMRDINHNISEVRFDPLGMVTVTSHYGTENGVEVGFMKLEDYQQQKPPTTEEVIANPRTYLQGAASYFHYDLFSWKDNQIPVHAVNLVAEDYDDQARVQKNITYSDGLGREVQSKMKVEPGEAFVVNPDGSIGTEITSDRWLASNRKVYNNKGNPVKEYEPYYIKGYDYVDNEELNQFGVSPTLFYDPLQRPIRVDTPKGFFTKVEFTPWQEKHYDENDTVVDSDYYRENIDNPDLDEAERQALQKAAVFYDTPSEVILDNLGRTVQEIENNQTASDGEVTRLTTHYELDITGNQLSSADPRLSAASIKNFQMTYTMTDEVLKTIGVDGGTHWQLNNVLGNPIYSQDSRNFEVRTEYDQLQRPVQVHVRGGDGATQLDQVVERLVYGESKDDADNLNLRGQVYQHYDQGGLLQVDGYNILGSPLTTKRQLRQEYKEEANWDSIDDPSALQPTSYRTQSEYDALGRVTAQTDADDNVYTPVYHESGRLNQIQVQHEGEPASTYVESIDYDPKGQRNQIVYGNGVTTDYEYEPTTFRLTRILTKRGATLAPAGQPAPRERGAAPHWLCRLLPQFLRQALGRVWPWGGSGVTGSNSRSVDPANLQDLNYTYDPVGNITQIADHAWDTVFNKNQQVDPVSRYTYDALYRLIEATGREHQALSRQQEQYRDIPEVGFVQLQNLNNGQAVENYTRRYSYDHGGNLDQIAHQGTTPRTRNLTVSETSNRAVDSELLEGNRDIDQFFDANGNQIQMPGIDPVRWNYRDNIANVTIIDRDDSNNDAEYYVYDSSGRRVRKVTECYGSGGTMTHIEEVIYLGGLEIRLSRQGETVTEERHCLRVMDDTTCVAIRNQWTQGEPPEGVINPQVRYQLDNHLGSTTMEVDGEGQLISYEEYFPYGGTAFVAGSEVEVKLKHYRYSGKERDGSTGLYYYGARYYAPWLGRWMSCDPAGTVDGLNLYAFVGGNPISHIDVGGMVKDDPSKVHNKLSRNIAGLKKIPKDLREKPTKLEKAKDYVWAGLSGGIAGVLTESVEQNYHPSYKMIKNLVPPGERRQWMRSGANAIAAINSVGAGEVPYLGKITSGIEEGLRSFSEQADLKKAVAKAGVTTMVGILEEPLSKFYEPVANVISNINDVVGDADLMLQNLNTVNSPDPSKTQRTYDIIQTQLEQVPTIHSRTRVLSDLDKGQKKQKLLKDLNKTEAWLERQMSKIEKRTGIAPQTTASASGSDDNTPAKQSDRLSGDKIGQEQQKFVAKQMARSYLPKETSM